MALRGRVVRREMRRLETSDAISRRKALKARSKLTGLEMRAIRESMGMSVPDIAAAVGLAESTWAKYQSDGGTLTIESESRLRTLAQIQQQMLARYTKALSGFGPGEELAVVWYERADDYASLAGNVQHHHSIYCQVVGQLCVLDPRVRLVAFDATNYVRWLRGRDDSEALRFMWAAQV